MRTIIPMPELRHYTAIHFTETLMLAGIKPSVGTVGDALDNGLAETTIGLSKTECLRDGSPLRSGPLRALADLEHLTSAWVSWYHETRLMHRLGGRPPGEVEAEYYAHLQVGKHTDHTKRGVHKTRDASDHSASCLIGSQQRSEG